MDNNSIFDKDFADDFMNKYGDVVEHWKNHRDPIKRGFAVMLKSATNKEVWTV
ncbi:MULTISPECIES: hypothetical protein [Methanococcoides]|jgi:hypothetical protein|uniref:Uncharacterized protein n=1 Tax=Methanococcoides seepicolus TaxID=2828780 RepID=A0A9E4ZHW1_9EURY|nr:MULTISPECIES: hypothetical protein [Methanococcoides]MCM1988053.1 hypothetical protein [Methanococcoides seepicolus]NOQ47887.1 hypothetical protein [Methanococcoides sp.]